MAMYFGRRYKCCRMVIYDLCCMKKDKVKVDFEKIKHGEK